jgi:hypothetical protein
VMISKSVFHLSSNEYQVCSQHASYAWPLD